MHCVKHCLDYAPFDDEGNGCICPICKSEESVRSLLAVINIAADRIRKSLYVDAELLLRRAECDIKDGFYTGRGEWIKQCVDKQPDTEREPAFPELDNSDEPEVGDEVRGVWLDGEGRENVVRGKLLRVQSPFPDTSEIEDVGDPGKPWIVCTSSLRGIKKTSK
jgi:hypothetical protein